MEEGLDSVATEWDDISLEGESSFLLRIWKIRLLLEVAGLTMLSFSIMSFLFRRGIITLENPPLLDVALFYAGFILLVILYLLNAENYRVD